MASITIRDLDRDVKERLRRRAAVHGRSMEAEARDILAAAVRPTRLLHEIYERSRPYATELDIPEQPEAGAAQL
ncbi:toxin-antitoxin system [Nocardia zapadnayensis]|uniref:FitA-like ribbon-helix-helix domain-containing protein n=1 Tax=Nocardia rhamnosiphila TaxID=426716 RepID=UPI0022453F10|nr:toxin-antitoxin system [Nocardia zapadnayensis]MCX0271226.1 toxin-antitoxin system [Nocardia zapadnayensis]